MKPALPVEPKYLTQALLMGALPGHARLDLYNEAQFFVGECVLTSSKLRNVRAFNLARLINIPE